MRWLILGAGGQVGRACCRQAAAAKIDTVTYSREDLDLRDDAEIARVLATGAFDLVVNAAAYTAVDLAESEPEIAYSINAEAPGRLAQLCREEHLPLIHFSTDYVFDGERAAAYEEEDDLRPLSVYGKTKAAGEAAVRTALPQHIILRTSWVFSPWGRNFVTTMLRLAGERSALAVVADQRGGPTSAAYLASAVGSVAAQLRADGAPTWGTYHLSGAPPASWYDFAVAIFEEWATLTGAAVPRVTAIGTADYPTPAHRPANAVLDCRRIAAAFGIAPGDWRRDLRSVLQEIMKEGGP
ncbi:MAG TPA: dTDP-4-dehydrorhamnose reductase [Kiloniellaceae bacterium]|nr:dTDP-4-dehydrorhamnose reductase [Kiloniellaceae bacterium]